MNSKNRQYLMQCLMLSMLMVGMFFFGEVESTSFSVFLRKTLVLIVAAYIVQKVAGRPLFSQKSLAAIPVLMVWLIYMVFMVVVVSKTGYYARTDRALFIGGYCFLAFFLLDYLYDSCIRSRILGRMIDGLKLLVILPIGVELGHFGIYGKPIAFDEMLAVYNTDFREVSEWFMQYVGPAPIILGFIVIGVIFSGFGKIRDLVLDDRVFSIKRVELRKFIVVMILIMITLYYPLLSLTRVDGIGMFFAARNYSRNLLKHTDIADKMRERIDIRNADMVADKAHTIVVVIGESACRDLMSAYNSSSKYDNTPWLKQVRADRSFVVMENAYSCQNTTAVALMKALTEMSQYNDKDILNSMNLMDMAKEKGYKTYWITDIDERSLADTYFLTNAKRADELILSGGKYDWTMLKELEKIDPKNNNFVVFHGYGSHAEYEKRYPSDQEFFKDDTVEAKYSNSLLYVDNFLKKVFEFSKRNLNLQMMVYFPDHGENLKLGHGPAVQSFDTVRIPMFIYFGTDYQNKAAEKFNRIRERRDWFYTNDMIYNTVCGLINAESNFYDSREDLSSEGFSYKKEDLFTNYGRVMKIVDDPNLRN